MKNSVKNLLEGQLCQIFYNSVLYLVLAMACLFFYSLPSAYFADYTGNICVEWLANHLGLVIFH